MRRRLATPLALAALLPACGDAGEGDAGGLPVDTGRVAAEDGVGLFYRTIGAGEQDVVIPMALYVEEGLSRLASPERRLVFYDPRGRGRSEAGDRSRITIERQHADLEAIRQGLGIDSMALVAWSGMGMEMAAYALRHPERVTRLVQVTPVAARDRPHNPEAYRKRAERTDAEAVAAVRTRLAEGAFEGDPAGFCRALAEVTRPASLADPDLAGEVPDVCRFPNEHPDSLAMIWPSLLGSFAGYDWREEIADLDTPRLVIHGAEDAFPLEGSREWVPEGSNARLLVLEGAAHFPWIERPEAFFPAVDSFLRGEWPEGTEP